MLTISNILERDKHISEEVNLEAMKLAHKTFIMPRGLIGFEDIASYEIELLDGQITYQMVGLPERNPIFYLTNPYFIVPEYSIDINEEDYALLGSPALSDIIVLSILTLNENIEETTCNLLGPILINNKDRIMLQIINVSDNWGTKHLLYDGKKIVESNMISVESES